MPRYVVERTFPDGLSIPVDAEGADICLGVVDRNADDGVTWVHSYVSDPRGDPAHREAQRAAGRPHHQGERPRSVLLPPRRLTRPSGVATDLRAPARVNPFCARRAEDLGSR
jgi:hypothetical protein